VNEWMYVSKGGTEGWSEDEKKGSNGILDQLLKFRMPV